MESQFKKLVQIFEFSVLALGSRSLGSSAARVQSKARLASSLSQRDEELS